MSDQFYRAMSDHKLQAAFQEIQSNLKAFPGEGWEKELALIQGVAKERGLTLDHSLSSRMQAIRGYLEQ
jgi:hypothetical protein